jgi:hypothetical protein
MAHYRVTGFIRIEGETLCDDDIWSDDLDLVVEADCGDNARLEAAHVAVERGLLEFPAWGNAESWEFVPEELQHLRAVELMAAEVEWHVRQEEDALVYLQMWKHGCGSLFGGLVKYAPA